MVEFRILGPLEVWAQGRPLPLPGAKQRALLAALLLHAGQVVAADQLVEDLWSEEPAAAAMNALWVQLTRLRKLLEPERARGEPGRVLITRPPGYLLRVEPDQFDLHRFERLAGEGRQALAAGAPEQAAMLLRRALDLWRGSPLADLAAERFLQGHIVRLEEERLAALCDRIDADLAGGRHGLLVAELERLAAAYPLRERFRSQLMLALYRSGRQAEALDAYRRTRRTLAEELAIEPSPELRRLERAILSQDPALELPVTVTGAGAARAEPAAPAPEPTAPAPAPPAPMREDRRTVTVVAASILASGVASDLDPESLSSLQDRYLDEVRSVIAFHGGTIQQLDAEAVLAVFGVPTLHENDPVRAVRATAELRVALERSSVHLHREGRTRLSLAAGIETGEVLARNGASGEVPAVVGAAVLLARRLERSAAPGELLLGPVAYSLVRHAVTVEEAAPAAHQAIGTAARAWRLVGLRADAPGRARRLDAPIVDRERELALVTQVSERALSDRSSQLVTILGAGGIGKTRLLGELLASTGERATVLRGRCPDYGKGITFWPLAEVVRQAIGVAPGGGSTAQHARARLTETLGHERNALAAVEALLGLLGLSEQAAPVDELPAAVRRLFRALARRRPLFVVLDDLHLAEPPLLDLLEDVADIVRDAPLVLYCLARTELFDLKPGWGGGRPNATTILLEPLDSASCATLIENLLGTADVDLQAKLRVPEIAEGNPLFIEELIAMLIDDDVLVQSAGSWVAKTDLSAVPIPPTISALLAARLERLEREERALLGLASVIGPVFSQDALRALAPEPLRSRVSAKLAALTRKELIRPDHSDPSGEDVFGFRHALIRDAAYSALPQRERAELHERLADWLEGDAQDQARQSEASDAVAYHLEQACRYRAALGLDAPALTSRAMDRLAAAAQRASDRWDHPAAIGLLGRARALLPADDLASLELVPPLVANLAVLGDVGAAQNLAASGVEQARLRGEPRLEARTRIEQLFVQQMAPGDITSWSTPAARREVEQMIPLFEQAGDIGGLGAAWYLAGRIEWLSLRCTAMAAALRRAIDHLRSAGSYGRMRFAIELLSFAYYYGPQPVFEAIQRCEELLREVGDNRAVHAVIQGCIACMEAMQGDFPRAWQLLGEVRAVLEDVGQMVGWIPAIIYHEDVAVVARLEGDWPRMEASLRNILDERTLAEPSVTLASDVAWLAEALDAQGRHGEVARLFAASPHLEVAGDTISQLVCRRVRARALARGGQVEAALRVSAAAVQLATKTDAPNEQADVWRDRAEVLRLAGLDSEAEQALRHAADHYRQKGNLVSEAQVLVELAGG